MGERVATLRTPHHQRELIGFILGEVEAVDGERTGVRPAGPHDGHDSIVATNGGASPETMTDVWFAWLDYLELAASNEGFTVH